MAERDEVLHPEGILGGESPLPVIIATLLALGTYLFLPESVQFVPSWVVPTVGLGMLVPLVIIKRLRKEPEQTWARWFAIAFAAGLTLINQFYIVRVIVELVAGRASSGSVLLVTLSVWVTNVIAYALLYWELDNGGPVERRVKGRPVRGTQHFRFPQQDSGPTEWRPVYVDYAYFSLSNMMAFSPTDTMPLTWQAKALMGVQALTGFVLLALVISRAVNILD